MALQRGLKRSGGYAHVYCVRSSVPIPAGSTTTRHVLKRLAVPDKPALQEVRHEVDVMKVLRHRNIIAFIEASASELPGRGYEVHRTVPRSL